MINFFVGFLKGTASMILIYGSVINIINIGGISSVVTTILNLIILISIWLHWKD